tara:strand:+ start:879 stop:3353 length:2475 start_codon:yes stop_codon:yes gene_type:complete
MNIANDAIQDQMRGKLLTQDNEQAYFEPSARIKAIRQSLFESEYSICLERPSLLENFWNSAEFNKKDHTLIQRAKALAYVFSHRKPVIYEDELISGNMSSKRIAANYYIESASSSIVEDIFSLEDRAVPLKLSKAEKLKLVNLSLRHTTKSVAYKTFFTPTRISKLSSTILNAKRFIVTEEAGVSHQVGNYQKVVHEGLSSVADAAKKCLEEGRTPSGNLLDADQIAFYEAIGITIQGIRQMAENLADEATRLARDLSLSEQRRSELLEIASACRRVPFYPARTLQEGLQACWIVHVCLNLEDFEQGLSFGRIDQVLYPLYLKDIQTGKLNNQSAAELLASFELKACETIPLLSKRMDPFFSGNTVGQGITLGGTDAEGNDVTNTLSGLFLDAFAQIRTREPNLHARVHEGTPKWFLDKAVTLLRMDCGSPALFGDAAIIEALQHAGMTKEHARDYAVIGCVETASQGRTYNSSDAALFNLPICLELALNEGKQFADSSLFAKRIGAKTLPVSKMNSFDDVVDAYTQQINDSVNEAVTVISWLEESYKTCRSSPVNSSVTNGCLDKGRDVTWGAADYDFTSVQAVGLADVGDSLFAIKKLVFDEQRMTLSEFVTILKKNFIGHEPLRVELANRFPRYGNGHRQVDQMLQVAIDAFSNAVTAHTNTRGGKYLAGIYSMTCNVAYGKITGALPNGRLAGQPLANGLSPSNGADRLGPTALLRSAASLDSKNWGNCVNLNIKFDKKTVQGNSGFNALSSLFRSYLVDQKGMQVQVNILDAATLRAAMADPSSYPGLLVRVAGYCAYFQELDPEVQQEIINRSEHGLH